MSDSAKRKTLAELRQSEHTSPLQRFQDICVAGKLVAQYEELDAQFRAVYNEGDAERSNARGADGPTEARRIAEQMEELRAEMDRHTVHVYVGKVERHDWREWAEKHPPRIIDGRHLPGCERDDCDGCLQHREDTVYGVNIDDLADDLEPHIATINGDKPGPGDWDFVQANASDGDLLDLARKVAGIHLSAVAIPKSRLDWLNSQRSDSDSRPPVRGE